MSKPTPTAKKGKGGGAKPPAVVLTFQITAAYLLLDEYAAKAEASIKTALEELNKVRSRIRAYVDEVSK